MTLEAVKQALENGTPEQAVDHAFQLLQSAEAAHGLGAILADCWRSFLVDGVVRVFELLRERGVDDAILNEARKALKEEFKLAQDWTKRLGNMKRARLLSEMRGAARERDLKRALHLAEEVVASGDPDKTLPLVGSVLGTCDDAAARQVAQALAGRLNLEPEQIASIHAAIDDRMSAMRAGGASANPEREFLIDHTEATLELAKHLPNDVLKGEGVEEKAVEAFASNVRGAIAACVRYPDRDLWPDIARLLIEFLPRELSQAGRQSGVEKRQYQSLPFSAKKVAALAFKGIGRNDALAERFVALAKAYREADDAKFPWIVELIGALRNAKAQPFLIDLLKKSDSDPRLQDLAVEALGNLGNDRSVEVLFAYLKGSFKERSLSDANKKRARRAIVSLGKIARNPNIDEQMRAHVMQMLRQVIPMDEHGLHALAVVELLSPRAVPKVDPTTRKWASRILTEELWTLDQQTSFATLDPESRPNPLGARAKAADVLAALAKTEMGTIVEAAEPRAMRFSGALMALGEVVAKSPSNAAIPMLRTMIRTAASHSAGRANEYEREQIWDPAQNKYVALDREPVLESLVYGAVKVGEAERDANQKGEGIEFVAELFNGAKSGEYPPLGEKASALLYDAHSKLCEGILRPKTGEVGRLADNRDIHEEKTQHFPSPDEPAPLIVGASMPTAEKEKLIKQMGKGLPLFGNSRPARIAAMQRLATVGELDAIPHLIETLLDKDAMIAAAAGTALTEYTRPGQPPRITEQAVTQVAHRLATAGFSMQKPLRKAMAQMNLTREPCRRALARLVKGEGGMGLAYELSQIMGLDDPNEAYRRITGEGMEIPSAGSGGPSVESGPGDDGAPAVGRAHASHASAMDEKRRLLAARREWIAGGKKGPEPR